MPHPGCQACILVEKVLRRLNSLGVMALRPDLQTTIIDQPIKLDGRQRAINDQGASSSNCFELKQVSQLALK